MHIKALILSFIRLKILKFSAARLYLKVLFLSIYRLKISKFSAARLYIFSTLYPVDEFQHLRVTIRSLNCAARKAYRRMYGEQVIWGERKRLRAKLE